MKNILRHLFLPQVTNNYRARFLHNSILLVFTLFFFASGIVVSYARTNFPQVLGTFSDIANEQLLSLTNQKRQENGVGPLSLNNPLSAAAANKASDMFAKDYWAHIAPDGTTPWYFIKAAGYNYIYAGENLARGYFSASDVVNAWMASPEHRQNMLSSKFQDVGFSAQTGKLTGEDTVLVVEMLGSTNFATAPVAQTAQVPTQATGITPQALPSPTPAPLPTPTPVNIVGNVSSTTPTPTKEEQKIITSTGASTKSSISQVRPLVNSANFSLVSSRAIISLFLLLLIMDMVIIERKKIIRFVGHNLDHAFFLSLIFFLISVLSKGSVV